MSFKTFFKLIDVKLSVASIIPVLLGSLYSLYAYQKLNVIYLILLIISMVMVQSSANILNDYFDHKRGLDDDKFDEKVLASQELKPKTVLIIMIIFQTISLLIGIYIAYQTSLLILAAAGFGLFILYFYAFGPLPISYTPMGEIVSGLTMGILITTVSIFIHSGIFDVSTILIGIPTAIYIGTILLSNNLSDMVEDEKSGRKTLPVMLGIKKTEKLWIINVLLILIVTILLYTIKIYPLPVVICAIIFFPYRKLKLFLSYSKSADTKKRTMGIIVKIGIRYHAAIIFGLMIAMFLRGK